MSDTHNTKNFAAHGGGEWVIGGKLTVLRDATVEGLVDVSLLVPATAETLGGVLAPAKGPTQTVPVGIDATGLLYVAAPIAATAAALGSVIAPAKAVTDTVPVAIDGTGALYVPTYPEDYVLPAAAAEALGGITLVANQVASAASTIADLKTDFNALLVKLKAAGVMAADA